MEIPAFLENGAVEAARALIGWRLYVKDGKNLVGGTIIETEAYTGDDAASHTYNGRTKRNEIMFGPAGHIYVYFTYGMHHCANIVTGKVGEGQAVLIRAILPDKGLDIIRKQRGYKPDTELTNGPAKVCQALGINLSDNGAKIGGGKFQLLSPTQKLKIKATKRIGIRKDTHRLWRFVAET